MRSDLKTSARDKQRARNSVVNRVSHKMFAQPAPTRVNFIICAWLLLGWLMQCSAAFNWRHVKPMYLVSMFPPPADEDTDSTAVGAQEPIILNLETEPMDDGMVPGGTHAMDRIFGGNVAQQNCFPYQVGLLLQRPKGLYWCGGALISDEFVLTAAHCVDMAKRALVFLGAHEIKNANEPGQMRVMVNRSSFIIFPTWNPKRLKDDIALVRLPEAIEFTESIQPIQLPRRSYEYRSFKDKLAIASGWGRYATGVHAISNVLRFVKLKIIDGGTCKRSFPLSYRATNICTSGFMKSTCSGDSGGPLVLRRKNTKKRVLIGLTSFGSIFGCDRGYPAAFTKVASYLDWISDEAGVEPYEETSNAKLFDKYMEAYQHELKRRQRQRQQLDDMELMDSIHNSLLGYPEAKYLQMASKKYRKDVDYSLFIL